MLKEKSKNWSLTALPILVMRKNPSEGLEKSIHRGKGASLRQGHRGRKPWYPGNKEKGGYAEKEVINFSCWFSQVRWHLSFGFSKRQVICNLDKSQLQCMLGIKTWQGWLQEKIHEEELETASKKHSFSRWPFGMLMENDLYQIFHSLGQEFVFILPSCDPYMHQVWEPLL